MLRFYLLFFSWHWLTVCASAHMWQFVEDWRFSCINTDGRVRVRGARVQCRACVFLLVTGVARCDRSMRVRPRRAWHNTTEGGWERNGQHGSVWMCDENSLELAETLSVTCVGDVEHASVGHGSQVDEDDVGATWERTDENEGIAVNGRTSSHLPSRM